MREPCFVSDHGLICLVGKNRWFVVSEEISCDWRFYGEDCECSVLIFVAIMFWSDKLKHFRGFHEKILFKYISTDEKGGAEHSWAPQTDLRSLLIAEWSHSQLLADQNRLRASCYVWQSAQLCLTASNSIFHNKYLAFTSTKSLFPEKSQHAHKVFNGTSKLVDVRQSWAACQT